MATGWNVISTLHKCSFPVRLAKPHQPSAREPPNGDARGKQRERTRPTTSTSSLTNSRHGVRWDKQRAREGCKNPSTETYVRLSLSLVGPCSGRVVQLHAAPYADYSVVVDFSCHASGGGRPMRLPNRIGDRRKSTVGVPTEPRRGLLHLACSGRPVRPASAVCFLCHFCTTLHRGNSTGLFADFFFFNFFGFNPQQRVARSVRQEASIFSGGSQ